MEFATADLCDEHGATVEVAESLFRDFGGRPSFAGPIRTVKVFEDNTLVRAALEQPGDGAVLVVDGGGSIRCALVGDQLAVLAANNGWAGLVVNGCIRDCRAMREIAVGVKALGTCPRKSVKRGEGQEQLAVRFAGVTFTPGHYVYADEDGVIVAAAPLT